MKGFTPLCGGSGQQDISCKIRWLNARFAKRLVRSARAAHRAAALPAWLLEEYMQYLKCLSAAWALASRDFAADQAVK